ITACPLAKPLISQRRRPSPTPSKTLAACGSRACRLPRRKFTKRCMDRSDFVDRKQIINHREPSAAKPQTNFGLSPAKTQRPQREKNIYPNLAFLAPLRLGSGHAWREEYPNPRCFVSWKIGPSRAIFQA